MGDKEPAAPAAAAEPAKTEPTTTEPATTEPATTGPATTEPATTGPATTEPATTEPATTEPATTEPATTEPATTEPATTEPATTEPATTEPATTEPAAAEPAAASEPLAAHDLLPADHWEPIAEEDDADSALGSDADSSTASIASSILEYRTLHGRTFHSERGNAHYWGANDEQQSNSLDILHHAFTLILDDKLHLAPIGDAKKVLDVGTGTGIWAIDFADAHPDAEVIGTDVSPIQPSWVPPNVKFEIEDFNSPWTFAPDSFDFIYMRYLVGSVKDWDKIFVEAYNAVEPGGWVESYEISPNCMTDDNTLGPKDAISQWGPLFCHGGDKIGMNFRVVDEELQIKGMKAAGFVDIEVHSIKVPSGIWPKDPRQHQIGSLFMYSALNDIEGFILLLSGLLGWTREQVIVYAAHIRREMKSGKHHVYLWHRIVFGRKPTAEEVAAKA